VGVADVCGYGGKIGGRWALGFLPVCSAATLEHLGKPGPGPAHTWSAVWGVHAPGPRGTDKPRGPHEHRELLYCA
jgi:hypothetical protein